MKNINYSVPCGVLESWLANFCNLIFFFELY